MRVLVACEFSGTVRDAFLAKGHDAMSCDLLPTDSPGPHYEGNVVHVLQERPWDLLIAHPPCTYLANSGVRWLHERPDRWIAMERAAQFFRALLNAPGIPRVAVENPVPHGYAVDLIGPYTQAIQPWQFGDGETKRVCLWLRGLPPLMPTRVVYEREARVHRMAPGPERQKERSRFFPGIATAMADQWTRAVAREAA